MASSCYSKLNFSKFYYYALPTSSSNMRQISVWFTNNAPSIGGTYLNFFNLIYYVYSLNLIIPSFPSP